MRTCPIEGCPNTRRAGQAVCATCWRQVPRPLIRAFNATRPYGDERRAALLEIYRSLSDG